jgi:putative intracellular protease/amidase
MEQTYSIAAIWNLDAQALNDSVSEELIEPLPVDGDALLRAGGRSARARTAWEILAADALHRLRNNHAEADRI